jgi:hypothetical protein
VVLLKQSKIIGKTEVDESIVFAALYFNRKKILTKFLKLQDWKKTQPENNSKFF